MGMKLTTCPKAPTQPPPAHLLPGAAQEVFPPPPPPPPKRPCIPKNALHRLKALVSESSSVETQSANSSQDWWSRTAEGPLRNIIAELLAKSEEDTPTSDRFQNSGKTSSWQIAASSDH